jgi:eukaryotic-like serine/threonine-protein kinase
MAETLGAAPDEFVTPVHPSVPKDLTGTELGARYRLLEIIGGGGMGTVYRGLDKNLNRPVAVKVLDQRADMSADPAYKERFDREAKVLQRLSHRSIVEVLDAGETAGIHYIVMEMLEGETLAKALDREGRLTPTRAVQVARSICEGLQFAHELGLVHRDLKPANVMLMSGGNVKLLDFGLAKPMATGGVNESEVTKASVVMGSPTYMAPEQARGEAGPTSDIYSVGVVLFRMLSGRLPFLGKASIDVIVQHLTTPLPWLREVDETLNVPMELELVMRRCLEKDNAARYQSAALLAQALEESERRATTEMPSVSAQHYVRLGTLTGVPAVSQATDLSATGSQRIISSAAISQSLPKPPGNSSAIAVAVGVVGVLGVLALLLFRPSASTSLPSTEAALPPAAALVTATKTTPEATSATKVTSVTFRINSIPAGATLKLDGKSIGNTPLSFELPLEGAEEATAELMLEHPGYDVLTFIVTSPGPRFDLTQRLQKSKSSGFAAPSVAMRNEPMRYSPQPEARAKVETQNSPAAKSVPPPTAVVKETAPAKEPETEVKTGASTPTTAAAPVVVNQPPTAKAITGASISPPTPSPSAVTLEGVTTTPRLIDAGTAPRYNSTARAAKVEGTVVSRCVVSAQGFLENCRIVKSLPFMDEEVLESLKTRRYEPAKVGEKAVATEMSVVVRLQLR